MSKCILEGHRSQRNDSEIGTSWQWFRTTSTQCGAHSDLALWFTVVQILLNYSPLLIYMVYSAFLITYSFLLKTQRFNTENLIRTSITYIMSEGVDTSITQKISSERQDSQTSFHQASSAEPKDTKIEKVEIRDLAHLSLAPNEEIVLKSEVVRLGSGRSRSRGRHQHKHGHGYHKHHRSHSHTGERHQQYLGFPRWFGAGSGAGSGAGRCSMMWWWAAVDTR